MSVFLGLACGLVAALPGAFLLWRGSKDLRRGVVAILFGFVFLQGVLIAVRGRGRDFLIPFVTLAVLAFLGVVVAAVIHRERQQ